MTATFVFYFKNGTVITSDPVDEENISMEFIENLNKLFTEVDGFIIQTLNLGGVIANVSELVAVKMNVGEEKH